MPHLMGIASFDTRFFATPADNLLYARSGQRPPVLGQEEVVGSDGLWPMLHLIFKEHLGDLVAEGDVSLLTSLAHHLQITIFEVNINNGGLSPGIILRP